MKSGTSTEQLKELLLQTHVFPGKYMFKFICPVDLMDELKKVFENLDAVISERASRNNNFRSLTLEIEVQSPEHVLAIYERVQHLPGVISL